MAIIPRYTSRALPPGAQSGLIESAQARGRAGAGLGLAAGDAIIAGAKYARRKGDGEADGPAKDRGNPKARRSVKSGARSVDALKNRIAMGRETVARQTGFSDLMDAAGLDAELAVARAGGVAAGRADGGAAGLAARRLAEFDGQAEKSLALFKDRPGLKQRADDIVASHARPYEARLLKMEAALRPVEETARLDRALGLFAEAARLDPAGVDGYIGRGLKALEEAGELAGLPGQEIVERQNLFARTAATAAVRGLIERDPEGALTRLEAGAFDARFDKADLDLLRGEAKTAARAKGARNSAAERARRRALALDMEEHLAALAETGRADETLEARARAELPEIEYAAFQADRAAARERYATRAEYAFLTPREIEADIEARVSEGGGGDGDERDRTHAIRTAIRDEVLTARAADPAGWAMRDEDVAAAFAAAEENPEDPALARKATKLRLALQREMSIDRPRLLSEAEREALGEELAVLPPTERLARIGDLKGLYGDRFAGLAQELAGAVAPDTEIVMARFEDPPLAGVLARGMERDGVEFKGARHLWLPLIDGRLDKSRLEDGQLYQFTLGNRILRVIYDRKADALVPALTEEVPKAEPAATPANPNLPDPSRPEDTAGETTNGPVPPSEVAVDAEPSTKSPQSVAGVENPDDGHGASPNPEEDGAGAPEGQVRKRRNLEIWLGWASFGGDPLPGWKELPRQKDGKIDRKGLEDDQIYHVTDTDGRRSAWRWNEGKRSFVPRSRWVDTFSIDGMHELIGIPVQRAPDGRPIYNMEQDRLNAINWDTDAVFEIADNPAAIADSRWQDTATSNYAKNKVFENSSLIERLADESGVDPDLVKAIMYREQAAGFIQPMADYFGVGKTVSPMGINPEKWTGLGIEKKSVRTDEGNIRAAIVLIRRIQERVLNPTVEKIATLYNGLMMEKSTDYGALVGRYYREKPWLAWDPGEDSQRQEKSP